MQRNSNLILLIFIQIPFTMDSHIHMVGAENVFTFRSELQWKTLHEVQCYFAWSSVLLRTKFGSNSYEVLCYFIQSSGNLKRQLLWPHQCITYQQLHRPRQHSKVCCISYCPTVDWYQLLPVFRMFPFYVETDLCWTTAQRWWQSWTHELSPYLPLTN